MQNNTMGTGVTSHKAVIYPRNKEEKKRKKIEGKKATAEFFSKEKTFFWLSINLDEGCISVVQ